MRRIIGKVFHFGTILGLATGLTGCAQMTGALKAEDEGSFAISGALQDFYDFRLISTDSSGGPKVVSVDRAADMLADYDVVFIGESHRHPAHHLAEMSIFRALYERNPNLTLSLEQFERDVQPVLDDFLAGKIGEQTLRDEGRAWDNYPTSYRPLVEFSKARGLPVIASEVPVWVVRCVGRLGPEALDKLTPEQRTWAAAELNLQDGPYKDKYLSFLGGSGSHGGPKTESEGPSEAQLRSFAAQVTRDDTMAESIFMHLTENPGRKVVHMNGSFHSESFLGTVERLALRAPDLKLAVVNPVEAASFDDMRVTKDDLTTGTLLLMAPAVPKDYVSQEEMIAQIRKVMSQRSSLSCPLEG